MYKPTKTDPSVVASRFINQTSKSVFLTGKAGTGKTTFLHHIKKTTHKKVLIVAPTGIAAINAGGVTIHSQFQLPFSAFIPSDTFPVIANPNIIVNNRQTLAKVQMINKVKRQTLRSLELLIIDEVSMLRADVLDAMDYVLRSVRGDYFTPFGGVQVLFIGDLMQLPPVVKQDEWEILKNYYDGVFFFHAKVLQNEKPQYIELEKIYRQDDEVFIRILNNLRNNRIEKNDMIALNQYHKPYFKPASEDSYITLTTHNNRANVQNQTSLEALTGTVYRYTAVVENDFPEHSYPTDKELVLKQGAQIIFVKNDPTGRQRFFNGKIGIVENLTEESIEVRFKGESETFEVSTYEWRNIKYTVNENTKEIEEEIIGTFIQYPIKLAWAITVHKSQGLTFERAIIDVNEAFAPGQVYVALSRLKSLSGLVLATPININSINSDAEVIRFASNKKGIEELTGILKKETYNYLKIFLYQTFNFKKIINVWENHVNSYDKNEKNSEKQKHLDWATAQFETMKPIEELGDKFVAQLRSYLESDTPDLAKAGMRLTAAKDYLSKIVESVMIKTRIQHEKMKALPKTKAYTEELSELETILLDRNKAFRKAVITVDCLLKGEDITKEHFQPNFRQINVAEEIFTE